MRCFFENVGINVGIKLNAMERKFLELILNDPALTAKRLSIEINKTKRTAERYLKSLQEKGYIERNGSNKNGYWKIIK